MIGKIKSSSYNIRNITFNAGTKIPLIILAASQLTQINTLKCDSKIYQVIKTQLNYIQIFPTTDWIH